VSNWSVRASEDVVPAVERQAQLADPGFGRYFTDHMASATWTTEDGWHDRLIGPRVPFVLDPAAAVLHYAQEIFEGLKAFRHDDGSVWLFRPEMNAQRFRGSAHRLALPQLAEQDFLDACAGLVRTDRDWVPSGGGERSLYLRPFMFAAEAALSVRPARRVIFAVVASPAGSYFTAHQPGGTTANGIRLWASQTVARAANGGTGAAKCGGNYAAGLAAQLDAAAHGCEQVLYVDGASHSWLEESGTMNLYLVTASGELVTPELGTILAGVTRDSVLQLAADHDLRPVERQVGLRELVEGLQSGTFVEAFACGTAAVITSIVEIRGADFTASVGDGEPGPATIRLRRQLVDIQLGRAPAPSGWLTRVS